MTERRDAFLAGLLVLGLVAAIAIPEAAPVSSDSSFAIVGPHEEVICAKSKDVCLTALKAIQKGWWTPFDSRDTSLLRCIPKNDCFPSDSLCIKGYNCP